MAVLITFLLFSPYVAAQTQTPPDTLFGSVVDRARMAFGGVFATARECGTRTPGRVITPLKADPDEADQGTTIGVGVAIENTGDCTVDITAELWADTNTDGSWQTSEEVCQSTQTLGPGQTMKCVTSVSMPDGDMEVLGQATSDVGYLIDDRETRTVSFIQPDTRDPDVDVDAPNTVSPGESFEYTVSATDNEGLRRIVSGNDVPTVQESCGGSTSCSFTESATAPNSGSMSILGGAEDTSGNTEVTSVTVNVGSPQASVAVFFQQAVFNIAQGIINAVD